jgi:hypothetical protein
MDEKSLDSYKNDQYWIVQYGFEEQISREKFYITLSTLKTIAVTDDLITEFNVTLLTYQNGDYIVDADHIKWDLTYDELQELVNTAYVETKYFWQLKNDKQAQILSATTSADVVAINWNTINPTVVGTYPTFNYYTKTQTDVKFATTATVNSHVTNYSNPHSVTKTQVGLSAVDNTSDLNKPISTATQTALNLKFNTSGIGQYATSANLNSHVTNTTNPHNVTANQVGNSIAQWNAIQLQGYNISNAVPTANQVLTYIPATGWTPAPDDDSMYATSANLNSHVTNTSNPHNVTANQVGRSTAQWNADRLQGTLISSATPTQNQLLTFTSATGWTPILPEHKYLQATYQPRGQGGTTSWSRTARYEYTVTVTGATLGDAVIVNPEASLYTLILNSTSVVMMMGYVSANNTVKVICKIEVGGTNITLANTDAFRVTVI